MIAGFGKLYVAAKVVGLKDRFDLFEAVASERGKLRYRGLGKSQPHHR